MHSVHFFGAESHIFLVDNAIMSSPASSLSSPYDIDYFIDSSGDIPVLRPLFQDPNYLIYQNLFNANGTPRAEFVDKMAT